MLKNHLCYFCYFVYTQHNFNVLLFPQVTLRKPKFGNEKENGELCLERTKTQDREGSNVTNRKKHLVLHILPNSLCLTALPTKWKTWNSERQCTLIPPTLQQTSGYHLFQKNFLTSTLKGFSSLHSWLLCVMWMYTRVHVCAQLLRRKGKCELKRKRVQGSAELSYLQLKIVPLISVTQFYATSQFAWFPRR